MVGRATSVLNGDMAHSGDVTLGLLVEADQRLVRTVDSLSGEDLAAPSLLPGWTRAQVVAHLALNGEALEGVLVGLAQGEPVAMYASQEQRDSDIDELASAGSTHLRERLMAATSRFVRAAETFPADRAEAQVERVPGGPTFPAGSLLLMRWREVEIHHADLGTTYSRADWTTDFAVAVLDSASRRPWPHSFRVLVREPARSWEYGDAHDEESVVPTVAGEARDLAWWITGRGDGADLTAEPDGLPEVPAW